MCVADFDPTARPRKTFATLHGYYLDARHSPSFPLRRYHEIEKACAESQVPLLLEHLAPLNPCVAGSIKRALMPRIIKQCAHRCSSSTSCGSADATVPLPHQVPSQQAQNGCEPRMRALLAEEVGAPTQKRHRSTNSAGATAPCTLSAGTSC
jgi:hypothetical protein